jgi:hypothetical protein
MLSWMQAEATWADYNFVCINLTGADKGTNAGEFLKSVV